MEGTTPLARCLIHTGTVYTPRDMARALETIEALTYRQLVDGELVAEGRATLVKIMAEPESATVLVNGCLFLNVLSFRYATFETDADGGCRFDLVGDGMTLQLVPVEDEETAPSNPRAMRIMETEAMDPESFVILDDEDEDEGR